MVPKFVTEKLRSKVEAIAAIDNKANRIPSPGSKLINGEYVNVCPKCGLACSDFPWRCFFCGWAAATEPEACPCQRVAEPYETEDGDWAYPCHADHEESPLLSPAERAAWVAAKKKAVLKPPRKPPRKPV